MTYPVSVYERNGAIRLAEVVAAVSLVTDLASGQPMEHGLRRALIAVNLAAAFGVSQEELSTAYYVALLGGLGCIVNTAAIAPFFQDEIRVRGEMFTEDLTKVLPTIAFLSGRVGTGESLPNRLGKLLAIARSDAVFRDVALHVGSMLELDLEIQTALGQCEEHWNGKGGALGLKMGEIALPARLFLLAQDAEVFSRFGGFDAAIAVAKQRSGVYYDPKLVEIFSEQASSLLSYVQGAQAWEAVLECEPEPVRLLAVEEMNDIARQIGGLVDMRSYFTLGHSSRVAELAAAGSRELGLSEWETDLVRQAGFFHDLGRLSVPVATWHKTGGLSSTEWRSMQGHPAVTELVLGKASTMGPIGTIAGLHHERLDGSGYRGATGASVPLTASLLATADAYQTKLEERPHRSALSVERAAELLTRVAEDGRLDVHVVDAVLKNTARTKQPVRNALAAGLTERELEVLQLLVRGLTNREISEHLVVSPKTVGHHIESIYDKIGVSTRVGATMFAVKQRLVEL